MESNLLTGLLMDDSGNEDDGVTTALHVIRIPGSSETKRRRPSTRR